MRAARLKAHYSEPARLRRLANLAQYARMGQMAHSEERSVLAILERKIGVSQTHIKRTVRLLEETPDLAADVEEGTRSLMAAPRDLEVRMGHKPR